MWDERTFRQLNPLMKYDYANNYRVMVISEIMSRFFKFLWVVFVFGVISITNAAFIRISIKCSMLIIFPIMEMQNRYSN